MNRGLNRFDSREEETTLYCDFCGDTIPTGVNYYEYKGEAYCWKCWGYFLDELNEYCYKVNE